MTMALLPREGPSPIFDRRVRITVAGQAVEALRVGFTIEKDLSPKPNTAGSHLQPIGGMQSRSQPQGGPFKARQLSTRLGLQLFFGEMREAFATRSQGTWRRSCAQATVTSTPRARSTTGSGRAWRSAHHEASSYRSLRFGRPTRGRI